MDAVKIKRDWLVSFGAYFGVYILLGVILFCFRGYSPSVELGGWENYIAGALAMLVVFGLLYLFAFRGGGTRYAGFFLFMQPINFLRNLPSYLNQDCSGLLCSFLMTGMLCLFWAKTYELYKLNKYLKSQLSDTSSLARDRV